MVYLLVAEGSENADGILAVDFVARMHETVRELTVGRKQQQAGCRDVQPADIDPAPRPEARQCREDALAPFWIMPRADLANRFVVGNNRMPSVDRRGLQFKRLAVQGDFLATGQLIAQLGRLAVDEDSTGSNPAFDLTTRSDAGVGQDLLDTFAQISSSLIASMG